MTQVSATEQKRLQEPEDRPPEPDRRLPLADRAAFADVFRRFYAPLARYACRITGDTASAADVLQDVFVKLWEDRERMTIRVSLQALLYTMVRNRALKMNRRNARIATDMDVEEARDLQDLAPAGDETHDAEDLRQHLYRWIGALPPRRAEAFVLSRYHGLSHAEIAALMGISERTVDTHILLALRELRHRLDLLQNDGDRP